MEVVKVEALVKARGQVLRRVLILVLVEVVKVEGEQFAAASKEACLNPCFSGSSKSRTTTIMTLKEYYQSLNPCFSGSSKSSKQTRG